MIKIIKSKIDPEQEIEIKIPGSKYIANRVLAIAALAEGVSVIRNIPKNNDIDNLTEALRKLGIKIEEIEDFSS